MAALVVTVGASVGYLKLKAPSFKSSALVQLSTATQQTQANGQSVIAGSTLQLVTSQQVADSAARTLNLKSSAGLASGVSGTANPTDNTVSVSATELTPGAAQAVANAFANGFVARLESQTQAQINALRTQQSAISTQLANLQAQLKFDPTNQLLLAQVTSAVQSYTTATSQLAQAQSAPPLATLLNPAGPGAKTRSTTKIVGLAALIGLLAGAGIALVRDQIDKKVRGATDVEAGLGLPVLAELPVDPAGRRRPDALPAMERPQAPFSMAIRALRTTLQVVLGETKCPVVLVTSPEPGDGKTFVAANLAASFALSGKRTIVVAGDMRRNHLDEVFSDDIPADGLATLLEAGLDRLPRAGGASESRAELRPEGDHGVWSMLRLTEVDRLLSLPAGATDLDPADLLASSTTGAVINQLRQFADVIVIDSPPALAVADPSIWAAAADGVVIVASADKTDQPRIIQTKSRLTAAGANLVGVALNRASIKAPRYGDYYDSARPLNGATRTRGYTRADAADWSPEPIVEVSMNGDRHADAPEYLS